MLWSENVIIMENTTSEESMYHMSMIIQPSSQDLLDKKCLWWWRCISDVIFPGPFEFPENREFSGIQSNFPGIPGNILKATVSPDLKAAIN